MIRFCLRYLQMPCQNPKEWRIFLELADAYFRNRKITRPVVVELGIFNGYQRAYYEMLWNAEYVGIDKTMNDKHAKPDIHGRTEEPATLDALKAKLDGRAIDLLFIDAAHDYESVRRDWEWYGPLCRHIVAFHDIRSSPDVARFFDELTAQRDGLTCLKILAQDGPVMGIGLAIRDAGLA